MTRRDFLAISAVGGAGVLLTGCKNGRDLPIDASTVPPVEGKDPPPWLGLVKSLRAESAYGARVEGTLPAGLQGTLYRNGPGLFERAGRRKRCILDGDGMVQAFRIGEGAVRYCNRFVRTAKFVDEEKAGRYRYATWTTQAPGGRLNNLFATSIRNQAGVSVVWKNGRLYAFDESTQPYELDPETLETVGLSHLGLKKGSAVYSAHSKTDGHTGEWLHFGLQYGRRATVHLTAFAADGSLRSHRTLALPRYVYLHDYLVSERYIILNLHPAEVAIFRFLLGATSFAGAIAWRPEIGNLVLVIPREGEAEPVMLETEATWMWHALNAHQRGDEIIADFVGYDGPDHFIGDDPALYAVMAGRRVRSSPGSLRRYVIDPKRKTIRQEVLATGNYEFPIVNPRLGCHGHRYGYLARDGDADPFWSQVVRIDTETGKTDAYNFGAGVYCGEPVFAPAPGTIYESGSADEPGWLLTQAYDGRTDRSFLAVLRADRVADGPVAVAHLRHHAPLSFHGWWQPEAASR